MMITRILYRGLLSSCNYACNYCPFAKRKNTREELDLDQFQLQRFSDWIEQASRPVAVFLTPWGEAIIHRYYRASMVRMSRMSHVSRVAIQTNLSGHIDDLVEGVVEKLALWATFHPSETSVDDFIERCDKLALIGIRFSVGAVGFPQHFAMIQRLREALPSSVYLWINAPKSSGIEYSPTELQFIKSVDPYFEWNMKRWSSFGKPCRTGLSSFTVDGGGDVRRCHFVDDVMGNIYADDIWQRLQARACPNQNCGCHIGYVYRDDFQLERLYGEQILERIPAEWPSIDPKFAHSLQE